MDWDISRNVEEGPGCNIEWWYGDDKDEWADREINQLGSKTLRSNIERYILATD